MPVTERLLQYIWQFQYFSRQPLRLANGETFQIIYPGRYNTNQGPDFLEAKIRIRSSIWVGHVELHIKTSDWYKHAHQLDRNYDNVILHVVWEHDLPGIKSRLPVFELGNCVPKLLLQQYEDWLNAPSFIPCAGQVGQVEEIIWLTWKERLLVERLQRKSSVIFSYLRENNHHWDETCWWLLARNFGITVNAESFESVARSLPVTLLAKHRNQLHQLESLLLGQAGLLDDQFENEYAQQLQKEYQFLKTKYQLKPICERVHFLRMRPTAFPTVRLAQLARLVHTSAHLFSTFKETVALEDLKRLFSVTANNFWHHHYNFRETSGYRPKRLGTHMIGNIIINTVAPLLFSYGCLHKEPVYTERVLQWLQELSSEKNMITNGFSRLCISNRNAFDSQALIELKTQYCDKKRCLDCAVGNALLKKSVKEKRVSDL